MITYFFSLLFFISGLAVPSSTWIVWLRGDNSPIKEQLILGALLFKTGLVILSAIVLFVKKIPIKKNDIKNEPSPPPYPALILTILVIATLLRLYKLNDGIWLDEILTHVNYMHMSFGEIITTYDDPNNHLLFTLLARLSLSIFGDSTWALRLPAVLFGIGSIYALYLFSCQVGSKKEALLSAALLCFSYHHIWFSQNARGYSGLLFFTILISWLFIRGLRENNPRLWIWYALTSALGFYTHINLMFVLFGHFSIYTGTLFLKKNELWEGRYNGLLFGFCLGGFLTLLLYSFILPQVIGEILHRENKATIMIWKNPIWSAIEFAKGMKIGFGSSFMAIFAIILFGSGMLSLIQTAPVVPLLFIIPSISALFFIVATKLTLFPRFFIFIMGFAVQIVIRGTFLWGELLSRIIKQKKIYQARSGTILCVLMIIVSSLSIPRSYYPKQDYKGAMNYIEQKKKPGDAVVTVGLTTFPYKEYYKKKDWVGVMENKKLTEILQTNSRTWLLYTLPAHLQEASPEIMETIKNTFSVVKPFFGTLGGGTIYVCLFEPSFNSTAHK